DSSHTIIEMLRNRQLDLGITSCPTDKPMDLQETLLLKDPFCVLLREGHEATLEDIFAGRATLPLIRFSPNQIISRQIESQLRRTGMTFSNRFECSNSQTQMAMVASGACWAITTPLLFSRAKRFQSQLSLHPFPGKSFSRRLAIYSTPDCSESVLNSVNEKLRELINQHVLKPVHTSSPWLKDGFTFFD
ncbi:MAG: LysR family transcriptional regulator substrate-binding protein, partial [Paracoccaceae bacterium]|nr:LysR family transcriptional regulator substrate-binding protein [Paracoccaceae bacterium]